MAKQASISNGVQAERPVRWPILYGFAIAGLVAVGLELTLLPNLASNLLFLALVVLTTLFVAASLGLKFSGLRASLPLAARLGLSVGLWGIVAMDVIFLIGPSFVTGPTAKEADPFAAPLASATATPATSNNTKKDEGAEMNKTNQTPAAIAQVKAATANLPAPPRLDTRKPAPDFDNEVWLNSEKLNLNALKGKVTIIEFWTFGCYNCRNVQPALKRWYSDYAAQGLEIVAFHAPEFDYEKKLENVQKAVREGGLSYPVAIDNDFTTWKKYKVQAWPTMFLLDKQGQIRYTHIGEGRYEEIEAAIVALLNEK